MHPKINIMLRQDFLIPIICLLIIVVKSEPHLKNKKGKLNECDKCNILIESYNYWFIKTARGKHEGGDAAWEETKLKSYALSEMRLVDIQEGLCSELKKHQDYCYTLLEESEQALEDWWSIEDQSSKDVYTWLCIETLKRCCPKLHYGEFCEPCILNGTNILCNGHGKCDGEGTRGGNGSCICNRGYGGDMCEICDRNYYRSDSNCRPCHKSCKGCTDSSIKSCFECNDGWEMKSEGCSDIDECRNASACKINEFCINFEGSFICKECDNSCKTCDGVSKSNCTACNANDILWDGMCINQKQKDELILITVLRGIVYFLLLVTSIFVYRTSKLASAVFAVLISFYIYYYEKVSYVKTFDTLLVYSKYLSEKTSR